MSVKIEMPPVRLIEPVVVYPFSVAEAFCRFLGSPEAGIWRRAKNCRIPDVLVCVVGPAGSGKDTLCGFLSEHALERTSVGFPACSTSETAATAVSAGLGMPEDVVWSSRKENRVFWKEFCDLLRHEFGPTAFVERSLFDMLGSDGPNHNGGPARVSLNGFRNIQELTALPQLLRNIDRRPTRLAYVWIDRPGFPADPTMDYTATDFLRLTAALPEPRFFWVGNDKGLSELRDKVLALEAQLSDQPYPAVPAYQPVSPSLFSCL